MTDSQLTYADFRRATAVLTHRAALDLDGVTAVFDEAYAVGRFTHLLRGVIVGYLTVLGELRTDPSLMAIEQFIAANAERSQDPNMRRGARAVLAYHQHDAEAFNTVLAESNGEEGGAAMVMASVVDLLGGLLPEVGTPAGLSALRSWTARLARAENDES